MTHTYALLEVTAQVHEEVRLKLEAAGYDHAFHRDDDRIVIDMHGIALVASVADLVAADRARGLAEEARRVAELVAAERVRNLTALRAVVDSSRMEFVIGPAASWIVQLYRAACAVVGAAPKGRGEEGESEKFEELTLRSRAQVVYEREVSAEPIGSPHALQALDLWRDRVRDAEDIAAALPGWSAVLDAEGDLVCLVPPGGAVNEQHREIMEARPSVVVEALNRLGEEDDRDLAELRAALGCVPPGGASGDAPGWSIRLHRAACAVAGIEVRDRVRPGGG